MSSIILTDNEVHLITPKITLSGADEPVEYSLKADYRKGDCLMEKSSPPPDAGYTYWRFWSSGHKECNMLVSSRDNNDTWDYLRLLAYDAKGTIIWRWTFENFKMTSANIRYKWQIPRSPIADASLIAALPNFSAVTLACSHC